MQSAGGDLGLAALWPFTSIFYCRLAVGSSCCRRLCVATYERLMIPHQRGKGVASHTTKKQTSFSPQIKNHVRRTESDLDCCRVEKIIFFVHTASIFLFSRNHCAIQSSRLSLWFSLLLRHTTVIHHCLFETCCVYIRLTWWDSSVCFLREGLSAVSMSLSRALKKTTQKTKGSGIGSESLTKPSHTSAVVWYCENKKAFYWIKGYIFFVLLLRS